MVHLLAEQKLLQQQHRPLFTPEEQEKWESKLGVGRTAAETYFCYHCQGSSPARPSDADVVELLMCSRCKQCWFCSRESHRAAWYSCHRHEFSKTLQRALILKDAEREALESEFGGPVVDIAANCDSRKIPYHCAKDANTGRFFECLTNSDVCLESQKHLIPPAHLVFAQKLLAKIAAFRSEN